MSRRAFLATAACAAAASFLPRRASALPERRALAFLHTHTGERLEAEYWRDGGYEQQALGAIDHILRDFITGDVRTIDRALLDLLADLRQTLGTRQPLQIISGYRSPATNAMLRARSGGVAKHSLHLEARALDLRIQGVRLDDIRRAALGLKRGGVGYYPSSDFVHVDTGQVRYW
jgi:uncharacterized protein YcbK (DUF882 family)